MSKRALQIALHIAFPVVPVWLWAWIIAFSCVFLVLGGKYPRIEKIAIFLTATFSLFTVFCVFIMQSTPYAFTWADVHEGFSFQMPAAVLGVALAKVIRLGLGEGSGGPVQHKEPAVNQPQHVHSIR